MGLCELCGKEEKLFKTNIEGTEINVCPSCSKFGKVISAVKEKTEEKKLKQEAKKEIQLITEIIVPDFPKIIREKREGLGISQEDFAKKLNEKESVIRKFETGELKPSLDAARRLEKLLKIRLVEEYFDGDNLVKNKNTLSKELTIGDLIKIKTRKNG